MGLDLVVEMRRKGISGLTWSYFIPCSFDAVPLYFILVHSIFHLRVILVWMGVLFSRGGDLNQSTQHEELLSWAAEIVARQRETQQADQRGDQSNPESGSRVQRTRYFASLTDLLRELLHEGEVRISVNSLISTFESQSTLNNQVKSFKYSKIIWQY